MFSHVWLCNPMGCSPPGSSVCGIFQERILEWVAIFSYRRSSQPKNWTYVSCIGRWILKVKFISIMPKRFLMHLCSLSVHLPMDSYITKYSLSLCMFLFSGILLQNVISLDVQSCPTLCEPMDCSMPGFPVHHQLLELAQTHVHWVGDAIQPSHLLLSPSPPAQSCPASGSFPMSRFFTSGGKNIGVSASASVLQWIFRTDFL